METLRIRGIPALVWGEPSEKVYLWVHEKMSRKEETEEFAHLAEERGYQTISFDLPEHGERAGSRERCDVFQGMQDLKVVGDYVFDRWKKVSLYGCSLGAFFSLYTYPQRRFERCLFQSPIVDMEYLVGQMMLWFDVTPERLQREGEIDTPVDPLRWDYFQYVKEHPITRWDSPTRILYGDRDALQAETVMSAFAQRHGCRLTIARGSDHPFGEPEDAVIVKRWLEENL